MIAFEQEFLKWANSNPSTKEKYGQFLEKDKALYAELLKTKDRDNVF
jgi:hypothetical protein